MFIFPTQPEKTFKYQIRISKIDINVSLFNNDFPFFNKEKCEILSFSKLLFDLNLYILSYPKF